LLGLCFDHSHASVLYSISLHDALPIYGHGGGDFVERDAVEERLHVFKRINSHAYFADFTESERMVGVHADLRGEVEGYGETFLRSEEHTSELQSPYDLVCRLLLEKKKL